MDTYIIILTFVGLAALGMAWMPSISRQTGISYSIFYVLLGIVIYLAQQGLDFFTCTVGNTYSFG